MTAKTDIQLQQDIETELLWDPRVNSAQIGVTVEEGAVSLLGSVDTYAARSAAEGAARRVAGVRTVAQDLKVKLLSEHARTDPEIAVAVEHALSWDVNTPTAVTASVRDGAVTLQGEVQWHYQRQAAESAVQSLSGVVEVYNSITLKPEISVKEVQAQIRAALQRQATHDANSIHISASGGTVTLTGHATSWQSIEDAAHAAWAARGVTEVIDNVKLQMSTS